MTLSIEVLHVPGPGHAVVVHDGHATAPAIIARRVKAALDVTMNCTTPDLEKLAAMSTRGGWAVITFETMREAELRAFTAGWQAQVDAMGGEEPGGAELEIAARFNDYIAGEEGI